MIEKTELGLAALFYSHVQIFEKSDVISLKASAGDHPGLSLVLSLFTFCIMRA
jgi:hypothetical protein